MIETTSGSPKDALLKAATNLVKDAGKLEKEFAEI
jgi:DNA-directed RNA polymerase subunit L